MIDADWHYVFYEGLETLPGFNNAHGFFIDVKYPLLNNAVFNFGLSAATTVHDTKSSTSLSFEEAYESISKNFALPFMVQIGLKIGDKNKYTRFSLLHGFKNTESFSGSTGDDTISGSIAAEVWRVGFSQEFKF